MIKQNKHILFLLFITFKAIKTQAQEINLVDNKGTIKTINNNKVTTNNTV